jgi:pimeloyl-ACP methyl ester carboxylesterase
VGAAVGMWLAANHPERAKSLSLHSAWPASGRHDMVTSTRFADPLTSGIVGSEVVVLEDCAHAPIYENVEEFNARSLAFLRQQAG